MSRGRSELPALDCHAHVAPDVTAKQLSTLNGAFVFAMTRSLQEAAAVRRRLDPELLWGTGVHPGLSGALASFDRDEFAAQLDSFCLVGEVGLDRRGSLAQQQEVLAAILEVASARPVLFSVHSTGRTGAVLDVIERRPHPGVILHWFLGTSDEIERACRLGCYFSINAAMPDDIVSRLPADRILPETDFPSSRSRTGAARPGDIARLETRISELGIAPIFDVRSLWYRNLGALATRVKAIPLLPPTLRSAIAAAQEPDRL